MRSIETRTATLEEKLYQKKMVQALLMDELSKSLYEFAETLTVDVLLELTDSDGMPLLTKEAAEEMERRWKND